MDQIHLMFLKTKMNLNLLMVMVELQMLFEVMYKFEYRNHQLEYQFLSN